MGIFGKRHKETRIVPVGEATPSGSPLESPKRGGAVNTTAAGVPPEGRDPDASPAEVAWRTGLWFKIEGMSTPSEATRRGETLLSYSAGRDHITYVDHEQITVTHARSVEEVMDILARCAIRAARDRETVAGNIGTALFARRMEHQPDGTWKEHDPARGVGPQGL